MFPTCLFRSPCCRRWTAAHRRAPPTKDGIVDGTAAIAGAGGRLITGSGFFCRRHRDLRYRRVGVNIVIFAGICDLCLTFRSRGRSFLRLVRISEVDHHFTFCFGGYLGVFLLRAGRLSRGIRICSAGIVPVLGAAVRPIAGGAAGRRFIRLKILRFDPGLRTSRRPGSQHRERPGPK